MAEKPCDTYTTFAINGIGKKKEILPAPQRRRVQSLGRPRRILPPWTLPASLKVKSDSFVAIIIIVAFYFGL